MSDRALPAEGGGERSAGHRPRAPRSDRVLAARVWAVVAGTLAGALAALAAAPAARPPDGAALLGSVLPAGVSVPDVTLSDETGRPLALRATGGRPAIVTFLTAACRDACPVVAQQIRGALDDLGTAVPAIAIATDARADTPAAARRFLARQHVSGRLRFALGDRAALARAWHAFGVEPERPGHPHTARVVLVDGAGRQRAGYGATTLTPEALAHDVRVLLAERRRGSPSGHAAAAPPGRG